MRTFQSYKQMPPLPACHHNPFLTMPGETLGFSLRYSVHKGICPSWFCFSLGDIQNCLGFCHMEIYQDETGLSEFSLQCVYTHRINHKANLSLNIYVMVGTINGSSHKLVEWFGDEIQCLSK